MHMLGGSVRTQQRQAENQAPWWLPNTTFLPGSPHVAPWSPRVGHTFWLASLGSEPSP